MPLTEQRRWKYSLSLDGLGCSNRLQKIMATGQVRVGRCQRQRPCSGRGPPAPARVQ